MVIGMGENIGKILSNVTLYKNHSCLDVLCRMVVMLLVLCLPTVSFATSLNSNDLPQCKLSRHALFLHEVYASECDSDILLAKTNSKSTEQRENDVGYRDQNIILQHYNITTLQTVFDFRQLLKIALHAKVSKKTSFYYPETWIFLEVAYKLFIQDIGD